MSPFPCKIRCIRLAAGLSLSGAVMVSAAPGDLITDFGDNGKVMLSESGMSLSAQSLAVQSDGRLITAGSVAEAGSLDAVGFLLARFLPNGAPDPSWNASGRRVFSVNGTGSARCVLVQPDGKVVCGGTVYSGMNTAFVLARFLPDGALDTSFNSSGFTITQVSPWLDGIHAMALLPDGKIVVAGTSSDNSGTNDDMVVARYSTAGVLDAAFNGTGIKTVDTGTGTALAAALLVQPDGRIVVAGSQQNGSANDFAVIRLNADGTMDSSFGASGKAVVATPADDGGRAIAPGPGGSLLVGGYTFGTSGADFSILRLLPNGNPDAAFGTTGRAAYSFGTSSQDLCLAMTVQDNSRIIMAGYAQSAAGSDFAILRLEPGGGLDQSFGQEGRRTVPLGAGFAQAQAIALMSDGAITTAGFSDELFTSSLAMVKLEGDASPLAALQLPPAAPLSGKEATLDFGRAHATVAVERSFVLLNQGAGILSNIQMELVGASAADFLVSHAAPASLAPNASSTVTLRFAPSAGTGSRSAVLHIRSNDQDRSPLAVSLAGTAETPVKAWRYQHFGVVESAGVAADDFDADGDSSSNLVEFFTGSSPLRPQSPEGSLEQDGDQIFYSIPRSAAAQAAGVVGFMESSSFTDRNWAPLNSGDPAVSSSGGLQRLRFPCGQLEPGRKLFRLRVSSLP